MEQNEQKKQFRCTGECLNCPRVQHEYCAAQKGYENQRLLIAMQETLKAMSGTVEELKEKIAAIQDSEAAVFNPNEVTEPEETDTTGTTPDREEAAAVKSPLIH